MPKTAKSIKSIKPWQCGHCDKTTRAKKRWCLLWGPVLWRDKRKVRIAVCAKCKEMLGPYC